MTTVVEPSTTRSGEPQVTVALAGTLRSGMMVTNIGLIKEVTSIGVFIVAAITGTVWSLATGTGDVHTLDVVWHESQSITIDVL